jgi:hypothetical protein
VHYFVNTSITATCMSVEVSHALQLSQWLAACRWFSSSTPISSTNKTDRSEKTEILLKMAIHQTKNNRKLSPTLGCVMGPIFTSLSNDYISCFQSHGVMFATMFGLFVFIPVYCIPRSCCICFFWLFPFAVVTILLANDIGVV